MRGGQERRALKTDPHPALRATFSRKREKGFRVPKSTTWTTSAYGATVTEALAGSLAELRREIDRIDSRMHALLIERGEVIDSLIAIKARQGGGSAFRPEREAAMMRALVERHRGLLPLDTVEGIWRIIISTFTYMQAPYAVHVDVSRGDAPMRDSARFHFGFTVPCIPHTSVDGVISAVEAGVGDLGMFAIDPLHGASAWWLRLTPAKAPKVIARLPFVERPDHPAGTPVVVIAKPLVDGGARDVVLESVKVDRWRGAYPEAIAGIGGEIIGNAAEGVGLSLLVARPGDLSDGAAAQTLRAAGGSDVRSREVGSHAQRFDASLHPNATK